MSTVRCGVAKDSSGNGRFYGIESFLTLDPSVTYTKLPTRFTVSVTLVTQTVSQMLVVKKRPRLPGKAPSKSRNWENVCLGRPAEDRQPGTHPATRAFFLLRASTGPWIRKTNDVR